MPLVDIIQGIITQRDALNKSVNTVCYPAAIQLCRQHPLRDTTKREAANAFGIGALVGSVSEPAPDQLQKHLGGQVEKVSGHRSRARHISQMLFGLLPKIETYRQFKRAIFSLMNAANASDAAPPRPDKSRVVRARAWIPLAPS